MTKNGLEVSTGQLPDYGLLQLEKDTFILNFLQENPCDRSAPEYSGHTDHWKKGEC